MKSTHKKSKGGKGPRPDQVPAINDRITLSPARWLVPVIVALLTAGAFLPTLQNGFVNWDDSKNFLLNPHYRGLGLDELRWMFTPFWGHYTPLTWLTFGLDYLLWGMDPAGYHVTNLLFHVATAVAFYFLTIKLLRLAAGGVAEDTAVWVGAAFAALFFAVHPLRVEAVAWITERRDILSGLFYVLTILAYLRASDRVGRGARWYWVSVILFACALLSKAMAVSVPVVLLILDVYPLRRLGGPIGWWNASVRQVYTEKIPFVLLAGVASAVAFAAVSDSLGTLSSLHRGSLLDRLSISGYALGFYLWKTIAPLNLSPLYELPITINPWSTTFMWSYLLVLICMVLTFALRHRLPGLLAAWLAYVVILLPVIGILQNANHLAADRYTYLSCLGWAIVAGAGISYCWRPLVRRRIGLRTFVFTNGVAALLVVGLGGLTWTQAQVWHDSERLWRHALRAGPESKMAHNQLGDALLKRGELGEAIKHFRQALQINPGFSLAHYNLGTALIERGELGEAIQHYRQALQINPAYAMAHNNLGNALLKRGELGKAIKHFRQALQINPAYAKAHNNLGTALIERGELGEAIQHYRKALQINPGFSPAHNNLGSALLKRGELGEAIQHYRQALQINPEYEDAYNNLGSALLKRGEVGEAIQHYRQALQINPEYEDAYNNLGSALLKRGEVGEAIQHYQQALQINPEYEDAYNNLGSALLKRGEVGEAIQHYQQALQINPAYAHAHSNLGNALLERGELGEAIKHYRQALQINPAYAEAHNNLGIAFVNGGKLTEATEHFCQALRLGYASAQQNLSQALALHGKGEEAVKRCLES